MVGLGPFEVFCQWRHSAPGAMVGIRLSPTNLIPLLTFGDMRPVRVQTDAYHRPLLLK